MDATPAAPLTYTKRIAVEQAIARGETPDRICDTLDVAASFVDRVLTRMNELAASDVEADLEPCGTHAAFNRHKDRGEPVDEQCRAGERAYNTARMRRARAEQRRLAAVA